MRVRQEYLGRAAPALVPGADGRFEEQRSSLRQHASWVTAAQSVFLPEGYPDSVTDDYLAFQVWDTIQAVCSYLRGILCTQAILVGVGVGRESATAVSAAVQWVLRDGAGMLGSMVFAWSRASAFGSNIKQWRFFADCINDVGLTLELLSPLFPAYFLLIASTGAVCKSLCGVAAGSTRAALSNHFAKTHNLADISAKEGIQETAVTLLGLVAGMAWATVLNESVLATWGTFVLLTMLHVYANYQAMAVLNLRTLNYERASILVDQALSKGRALELKPLGSHKEHTLAAPRTVNELEPIVPTDFILHGLLRLPRRRPRIRLGVRFDELCPTQADFEAIHSGRTAQYLASFYGNEILVVLAADCSPESMTKALYHAKLLQALVCSAPDANSLALKEYPHSGLSRSAARTELERSAREQVNRQFDSFWASLQESEWNTSIVMLSTSPWRADWVSSH